MQKKHSKHNIYTLNVINVTHGVQYNNSLYFCDPWERKRRKDVLSNVGLVACKVTVSCA